ncbi:hypothetical protein, partial [Klebsiella pneumoniae]|uniref:hypothetical protein n=1 Tax=Klebsiella pneumoniae TaxID=573 RepID=UPI0023B2F6B6
MQELISQIAALGIEITPTRSLMIIFGIILFTAVVVGNDSNLLIVFYVQIMPDDLVMQLHR